MKETVSHKQAMVMLLTGIVVLPVAFGLALYSVPSEVPGLPSFPFFSLPFPLLSLLLSLSSVLIAMGSIFLSRGSLGKLMIVAALFVAAGIVAVAVSFVTAIPVELEGITIYVEPYGAHAFMVLSIGPLLAFFGLLFWVINRAQKRKTEH